MTIGDTGRKRRTRSTNGPEWCEILGKSHLSFHFVFFRGSMAIFMNREEVVHSVPIGWSQAQPSPAPVVSTISSLECASWSCSLKTCLAREGCKGRRNYLGRFAFVPRSDLNIKRLRTTVMMLLPLVVSVSSSSDPLKEVERESD